MSKGDEHSCGNIRDWLATAATNCDATQVLAEQNAEYFRLEVARPRPYLRADDPVLARRYGCLCRRVTAGKRWLAGSGTRWSSPPDHPMPVPAGAYYFGSTDTVEAGDTTRADVMELTGGTGVDMSIEAVGYPETLLTAASVVRPGGTIAKIGVHSARLHAPPGHVEPGRHPHRGPGRHRVHSRAAEDGGQRLHPGGEDGHPLPVLTL